MLVVTRKGANGAYRAEYSAASVPMCIAYAECASEGGSIYPCQENLAVTNLLEKPLKGFIVNPADLPRKGKSRLAVKVYKLCRVLKLVYQPCSRTQASRKTNGIVAHLMMMLLMMIILMTTITHVYDHVV